MSIEFMFFNKVLRDRFVQFVLASGIACRGRKDMMGGFLAELPDDFDEAKAVAIDAEYDLLMKEQMDLAGSEEDSDTQEALGVSVTIADGQPCLIRIHGPLGRRLAEAFTTEEIHALITAIAQSIENPIDGPLCRTV